MKSTIMVVDAGGRGAALVHAYSKSPHVDRIIAIPGNDMMHELGVLTHQNLKTTSISDIIKIARQEGVMFVDVAQDNAIAAGLVDELEAAGIKAFGPTKEAGQIEWDKSWAREFGLRHGLPQPEYQICKSIDEGLKYINGIKDDRRWFIKASALAEGKGVLSADSNKQAIERIHELYELFPEAARTYLIEETIVGEEFSAFALCDGKHFQIVGAAQDHKRVNDGDQGPNTGGMGCSTPPLVVNPNVKVQISKIFEKTLAGMREEGRPYKGVLYLGGIIKEGTEDVYIIEFNSRWGDPEVEVIMPGIKTDLYEISKAVIAGDITNTHIETDGKVRVCVAGVSTGYPGDYSRVKGKAIRGLEKAAWQNGVVIYGAGIRKQDDVYVAYGGRLFYVVAEGADIIEARERAYAAMELISIDDNGLHYRTDIGYRDVARLSKK